MIKMNKKADNMLTILIICLIFSATFFAQDVPENDEGDPNVHRLEKIVFHGNNAQGTETITKESNRNPDNAPSNVWEWKKDSVIIAQPTAAVPLSVVITPQLANGDQLTTPIQWSASGGTVSIPNAGNPNHENAVFDCPASVGLYRITARLGNGNGTSAKTIAVYVAAPKIKDVTFQNSISIRRDREATASFGTEYTGISWRDDDLDGESDMGKPGAVDANVIANGNGSIHSHPVAYHSKGILSASINLCPFVEGPDNCALLEDKQLVFKEYYVTAEQCKPVVSWKESTTSNSWHSCSVAGLSANQNYEFVNALTVTSSEAFRNTETTVYEPNFQLRCEVGFGKSGDPQAQLFFPPASSSTHELYLLFKYNSENFSNYSGDSEQTYNYETVFHIGCTRANGKSAVSQIIDSIWAEFTDRVVKKKGCETTMKYWGSFSLQQQLQQQQPQQQHILNNNTSITRGLLYHDDGRCGAWADFYRALLIIQGISGDIIMKKTIYHGDVTPNQYNNNIIDKGFLIKNYSFSSSGGTSGNINYPYILSSGQDNECIDEVGIPAQGNPDPVSSFINHALIIANNTIYDPSYGGTYESLIDYRNTNIAGWIIKVVQNGNTSYFSTDTNHVTSHQLQYIPQN